MSKTAAYFKVSIFHGLHTIIHSYGWDVFRDEFVFTIPVNARDCTQCGRVFRTKQLQLTYCSLMAYICAVDATAPMLFGD